MHILMHVIWVCACSGVAGGQMFGLGTDGPVLQVAVLTSIPTGSVGGSGGPVPVPALGIMCPLLCHLGVGTTHTTSRSS